VFLALAPIDLRYSFDRLIGLARERVGYEPSGGALFIFFGKRRAAAKVLFVDATGTCIFYKRLKKGTFQVPQVEGGRGHVEIDEGALEALLHGFDFNVRGAAH
jgi:transposase